VEALECEMTKLKTEHELYREDMEQSLATVNAALAQRDTHLGQVMLLSVDTRTQAGMFRKRLRR